MNVKDLKCYPQVAAVIGEALADYELGLVDHLIQEIPLDGVFQWDNTPQRHKFWSLINKGQNPYEHGHEKPEVKEWAYIDYTVAGDSKITQWCEIKDKHYMGLNLMVLHESKDVEVFATHKSVIMPDWVPADLAKLDYNPEEVAFSARLPQEDKRTAGIHANTEIFVPESQSGDKKRSDGSTKDMKFDGDKIRMELLPFNTLEAVAEVLTFGANKYEANSWQTLDHAEERYKGALLRHFSALQKGEALDSESGLPHAAHMACDALFLLHFELEKLASASE